MEELEAGLKRHNIEAFIAEVEKHPVLWNTTLEEHNDRKIRQESWVEVARTMFPNVPEKDVPKAVALLMKKWRNLRDNYKKNLRLIASGKVTTRRRYVYFKKLTFLDVTFRDAPQTDPLGSDSSEYQEDSNMEDGVCDNVALTSAVETNLETLGSTEQLDLQPLPDNPAVRKRLLEESMITYLRSHRGVYTPDEDQSFFESILPTVRQFDVDQKFEFRIQVMSIIQNIRNRVMYCDQLKENQ